MTIRIKLAVYASLDLGNSDLYVFVFLYFRDKNKLKLTLNQLAGNGTQKDKYKTLLSQTIPEVIINSSPGTTQNMQKSVSPNTQSTSNTKQDPILDSTSKNSAMND